MYKRQGVNSDAIDDNGSIRAGADDERTVVATDESQEEQSKSSRKRDAQALFKVAGILITAKTSALKQLNLPDNIRDEIDKAARIRSHGAKKRQTQYLARLLREHDFDAETLETALNTPPPAVTHPTDTRASDLTDLVIADYTASIDQIREQCPDLGIQQVSQLHRRAMAAVKKSDDKAFDDARAALTGLFKHHLE